MYTINYLTLIIVETRLYCWISTFYSSIETYYIEIKKF